MRRAIWRTIGTRMGGGEAMRFAGLAAGALVVGLGASALVPAQNAAGRDDTEATRGTRRASSAQPAPAGVDVPVSEGQRKQNADSLLERYSRAESDGERARIKEELASLLKEEFDAQQERRTAGLARVEADLRRVRELLRRRVEARGEIVERRLDQLLREASGMGWSSPVVPTPTQGSQEAAPGPESDPFGVKLPPSPSAPLPSRRSDAALPSPPGGRR